MGRGARWQQTPGALSRNRQTDRRADSEKTVDSTYLEMLAFGWAPLQWRGRPKEFKRLEAAAGARLALVNRYGLGGAGVRVLSQRGKAKEGLGKVKRAAGKYILLFGSTQHALSGAVDAGDGLRGAGATVGCAWGT